MDIQIDTTFSMQTPPQNNHSNNINEFGPTLVIRMVVQVTIFLRLEGVVAQCSAMLRVTHHLSIEVRCG